MFLPVLFVRDYGLWGWIVFAAPNVIGAAAMGWVMRRVRDPQSLLIAHRGAILVFSAVTVAFHLFFLLALSPIGLTLAILASVLFTALTMGRHDTLLAALVFCLSLAAFALFLSKLGYQGPLNFQLRSFPPGLAFLAPVSIFGFALCPYLDHTFHRAFQATGPNHSRQAFALGFGLFFLLMILFTLSYARPFAALVPRAGHGQPLPRAVMWIVGIHVTVQSAFTICAHLRFTRAHLSFWTAATVIAVVIPLTGFLASAHVPFGTFETTYRLFMGFYGLAFPAYVWLVMIPTRAGLSSPTRGKLFVLALALLVAAPMFWSGFIMDKTQWLAPGLATVILARLLLPRPPSAAIRASDEEPGAARHSPR